MGKSTFVPGLWGASLLFFLTNVGILGIIVRDIGMGKKIENIWIEKSSKPRDPAGYGSEIFLSIYEYIFQGIDCQEKITGAKENTDWKTLNKISKKSPNLSKSSGGRI